MNTLVDRLSSEPAVKTPKSAIPDDMAMIRAASELTRDLVTPSARIYWTDFLASTIVGYAGVVAAILAPSTGWLLVASLVAVLALYRAGSFIHELTHIRKNALPGFRFVWNLLVGVPLLIPSFMYEGIHSLHHNRTKYGTVEDPEYLPLALMKPWTVPLFVLVSVLGPAALLLRYGVLGPLSLVIPPLRTLLVERYSGLVINPEFRRRYPEGRGKTEWIALEVACSLWAMALLAGVFTGFIPLHAFLVGFGIVSAVIVLNQLRTLVAHLWENDGAQMSITAQYLDSVNVPPPSMLPALWAPVGLRYHALHHLLPSMPYHSLGEAHRRLSTMLESRSAYHRASYPQGLPYLVKQLVLSTFRRGA